MACKPRALTKEQRARQRALLLTVRGKIQETRELPEGFDLRLPTDMALFRDAAEWIALERKCCAFISYALRWSVDDEVWVTVTGGPEGKPAIAAELLGRH